MFPDATSLKAGPAHPVSFPAEYLMESQNLQTPNLADQLQQTRVAWYLLAQPGVGKPS